MKKLLLTFFIIPLVLIPLYSEAVTGQDIRTDWSLGESVVVVDATSPCTDTAVARADWSLGESVTVIDATATCAAAADATLNKQDIFWFE